MRFWVDSALLNRKIQFGQNCGVSPKICKILTNISSFWSKTRAAIIMRHSEERNKILEYLRCDFFENVKDFKKVVGLVVTKVWTNCLRVFGLSV